MNAAIAWIIVLAITLLIASVTFALVRRRRRRRAALSLSFTDVRYYLDGTIQRDVQ